MLICVLNYTHDHTHAKILKQYKQAIHIISLYKTFCVAGFGGVRPFLESCDMMVLGNVGVEQICIRGMNCIFQL